MRNFSKIRPKWNNFWFTSGSPVGFAMFRVAFCFILLLYHVPRLKYIRELYTPEAFLVPKFQFELLHLPIFNYYTALLLNVILIISILLVLVGAFTRPALFLALLLTYYFSMLENLSTKGYGALIIIYTFFLLLTPSGAFLSVDAAKQRFKGLISGRLPVLTPIVSLIMHRIMLIQLASVYFFNAFAKAHFGGRGWLSGEHFLNMYRDTERFAQPYVLSLLERMQFVLPAFGVFVLVGLFFVSIALFIRSIRLYAIIFGVLYHTVALLTLKVPYVFSFLMFSLYFAVIEPEVWARWWERAQIIFSRKKACLLYDGACGLCMFSVNLIKAFDFLDKISLVDISANSQRYVIKREDLLSEIHLIDSGGRISKGFFAFRKTLSYLPHGWLFLPFAYLPGASFVGSKVYKLISRNRYGLCRS